MRLKPFAAPRTGSGGVVVESVVDLDTGAVEQLVLEVGRGRKRNGEGLVGFLAPDEPHREHTRGDGQPEVHDVHSEHAVGLRWEDDLVESVCPFLVGVTVHVLVGLSVPEVGEHVCVRGVNDSDGLAPSGRVAVDLLEVRDWRSDGVRNAPPSLDGSSHVSLCKHGLALKLLGLVIVHQGGVNEGGLVGLYGRGVGDGG